MRAARARRRQRAPLDLVEPVCVSVREELVRILEARVEAAQRRLREQTRARGREGRRGSAGALDVCPRRCPSISQLPACPPVEPGSAHALAARSGRPSARPPLAPNPLPLPCPLARLARSLAAGAGALELPLSRLRSPFAQSCMCGVAARRRRSGCAGSRPEAPPAQTDPCRRS
jgi:hypothetical protein